MDSYSHRLANALAGNPRHLATIEITLMGPELLFEDARTVAIAGATFALTLDGSEVSAPAGHSTVVLDVPAGSRLTFGTRQRGARAYLAVRGGIAVPYVLGSRATHLPSRMGGFEGRALKAGDLLPIGDIVPDFLPSRSWALSAPLTDSAIRVLPYDTEQCPGEILAELETFTYRVGIDSNRIGFRLEGPALTWIRTAEFISDASPLGAIQVPPSGQPIVLMADRQTTGGYPKLAIVISADMGGLGQLAPGDSVRFRRCSPEEALRALHAQDEILRQAETRA
jgi:biotin-dependent carboxylase-like uncharacterized protein